MRRYFVLVFVCLLIFTGCGGGSSTANPPQAPEREDVNTNDAAASIIPTMDANSSGDIVEITEKLFIAQCNDIYLNPNEYIGKTIRIEGMYDEYTDEAGITHRGVIRNGPGCCGNDGVAGFQFSCKDIPICKPNDWISVEGIIMPFTYEDSFETIIIEEANIIVKTERGAEYVTQ
jgi:uncharacterized membrane protein YcgQ (UPF0703/DUF1980 family)